MCCYYSKKVTAGLKRRFKRNGGKLTLYAVRQWFPATKTLRSPCRGMIIEKCGWQRSNRASPYSGADEQGGQDCPTIAQGKHVLLTKADAEAWIGKWALSGERFVILPMRCHERDLIGAGEARIYKEPLLDLHFSCPSAVFQKAFIYAADFRRALKGEPA